MGPRSDGGGGSRHQRDLPSPYARTTHWQLPRAEAEVLSVAERRRTAGPGPAAAAHPPCKARFRELWPILDPVRARTDGAASTFVPSSAGSCSRRRAPHILASPSILLRPCGIATTWLLRLPGSKILALAERPGGRQQWALVATSTLRHERQLGSSGRPEAGHLCIPAP